MMLRRPVSLTWSGVTARRMARHALTEPAADLGPADIAGVVCGAHAQVLSAAELSIGRRIAGATRADVQRALWEDRTLVKTFGPRGTVHLLSTADLPMWTGALSALPSSVPMHPEPVRFTAEQADEVIAAIGDALADTELTVDELLLSATANDNPMLMERIADLINEVYAVAEAGLWIDGATRTTVDEVTELTRAGQIAVARLRGRIVGSVRVQRLDESTGELGMLVADPAHRGVGVGRELVGFAERTCSADGLGTMQLELLVPGGWTHPTKEFLAAWYTRIGYRVGRTGTIDEAYPALAPLLAAPCDFVIYEKDLAADPGAATTG